MPAKKYLSVPSSGIPTEVQATVTSSGASNAGDIPALDDNGQLDISTMPTGVGAATITAVASESLAAGDLVNLWDNAGTMNVRKADASASSAGKRAHGFVLASFSSSATATVYIGQASLNTGVSGLTVGAEYFLSGSSAGGITTTAPSTSGHLVQSVGVARTASALLFNPQLITIRA